MVSPVEQNQRENGAVLEVISALRKVGAALVLSSDQHFKSEVGSYRKPQEGVLQCDDIRIFRKVENKS